MKGSSRDLYRLRVEGLGFFVGLGFEVFRSGFRVSGSLKLSC